MGKQSFIIGRAGHITLYDDTVSRRHACLEVEDDALYLRDLKSRNGTYEIRDKKLVPFTYGRIRSDQVFAFGECVRSVVQLLKEAGIAADNADSAEVDTTATADDSVLDSTQIGFSVPAQRRLSPENIVEMLEQIEDHVAGGGSLTGICTRLGVTPERYTRWCAEYGASRDERAQIDLNLREENERLRKLVADLSLERDAMLETLNKHRQNNDEASHKADDAPPNFTIVGRDTKP